MNKSGNAGYAAMLLLAGLFVLDGCATKLYGRMSPLTESEKSSMTCKESELEYQKTLDYMNQVGKASQPSGADAVAVLIDLGSANEKEKKAAMESAEQRRDQIIEVRVANKCGR